MELPNPYELRKHALGAGQRLHPQHMFLFEALVRRVERKLGPLSYDDLALVLSTKSEEPRRVLASRVPQLRRALEPFGVDVVNYRNRGYALVCSE